MKSNEIHPFPPIYDGESKILILGSFPSVKSRENNFFYGHPKNRFWEVIAAVLDKPLPETIEEKKKLLLENRIALWDVIKSCDIEGSADITINNVVPNDLSIIMREAKIGAIFCNGKKAAQLYQKHAEASTNIKAVLLPSTSPANATWSLEKLKQAYASALLPFLNQKFDVYSLET